MKKMLLLIMVTILLTGCTKKLNQKDYEEYLIYTYGDLNFEYVSKNEACDTVHYQSECQYFFTTPELNGKKFLVEGRFNGSNEKQFIDTYIKTKYDKQLKEYYGIYFESILQNGVEIVDIAPYYKYIYNIPNISFDNYLKYIEEEAKEVEIIFGSNIKLDNNEEINMYIYNNYDIHKIKKEVKNIISNNELDHIKNVSICFNACEKNESSNTCNETISLYEK